MLKLLQSSGLQHPEANSWLPALQGYSPLLAQVPQISHGQVVQLSLRLELHEQEHM